jgi:glycerol kinase
MIESAPQSDVMAESVDGSDGVYFVPALTGLGAPHWDPYARGMIIGITRGTTRNHIARAALEGIAYQVADLADAMQADAGSPITELRVDGGAAASDFLMQFQADLLRIPVVRPTVLETTALGAAYMAGLAVGYWESVDEIAQNWQVERIFEPRMPESQAAQQRARWSEAVKRSKGWERSGDA